MHFGRSDNIGPNRSSSMGMGPDVSGSNFHQQMGNMQRPGGGGNMIPNHMNQMNYMNQQQRMNMNQQINNAAASHNQNPNVPSPQQMSQQQMHQMQQHQRMLNHQRMMMMNAAHHNNSHSQLMRPSGPNMSKIMRFVSSLFLLVAKFYV